MKTLSTFIMIMTFCFSVSVSAEDKTIDQMLNALKMEKIQAEIIADTMARRGKLSVEEVSRVKRDIASVKEEDSNDIKADAIERLSSKNSFATK